MPNPISRRAILRAIGAGGLLAGTGLLGACAPSVDTAASLPRLGGSDYSGPPVRLGFWNGLTGGDGPVMRTLIAQFTREHPNIHIDMYALPWTNFYQKFPAAVVSGIAPDFALMQNFQVTTNAARHVIMPVDEVFDAIGLRERDYVPVVWKSGLYRDRRWSLPLDMWPDALFYNRTVLAKAGLDPDSPPRTDAEYQAALETMRDAGIQGHWIPAVDAQSVGRPFDSLLWQFGGTHYNEAGTKALFDSAAGARAVSWQADVIRHGHSPRNASGSDANIAFKNNQNAFLWGGPGALINDLASVDGLDWDVAPMPTIGEHPAAFSGSHQFVIARQRNFNPDRFSAVVTFLRWILANSQGWAKAGPVPARLPALKTATFRELTKQAHVAEGVDSIRFYPLIPGIAEVQTTVLYPAVSDALLAQRDPGPALREAARQAGFLLTENTTKYGESA